MAPCRCRGISKGKTWDVRLKAIFRAIRRAFLAHRDGARVFAGTYVPTDNVLRIVEAMMALMQEAGASPELSSDAAFSLVYYVLGFTMEEQGLDPRAGGPLDLANRQAEFANLAAMKYPSIHAALHRMFDNDLDDRFEAGLDLLINGLKVRSIPDRNCADERTRQLWSEVGFTRSALLICKT